ncbi:MAG: creatininase family protein [Chloroflexota bacterium]
MNLAENSWMQAREALTKTDLLIIPLGATETYGPHLPMGSETMIGDYVGKQVGDRTSALVTPTIPITCSGNLESFPGNLYISNATLKSYLMDLCERGISWGVKRVFFLNIHGPNMGTIEEVSRAMLTRGVRCAQIDFWRFMLRQAGDQLKGGEYSSGHASEMAASSILALRPELVQVDKYEMTIPKHTLANDYPDVMMYYPFSDITPTGHTGDPTPASVEAGQVLLDRVVNRLVQFLEDWRKEEA